MKTSAEHDARRRGPAGSRPREAARLLVTGAAVVGFLGAALYAALGDDVPRGDRSRVDLVAGWDGESGGEQVLGGERVAGRPTVQRMVHDDVQLTVSVAPARPGPNLVRVDTLIPGSARHAAHEAGSRFPVRVGTSEEGLVRARPRPGVDGLWAVVDLPEESGMLLVSHGPEHRIPFVISTGQPADQAAAKSAAWTGPDGPECLARATGALISGSAPPAGGCPSERLGSAHRAALTSVVRLLAERGVEELSVASDASRRSVQAVAAVRREAAARGVRVVAPTAIPGARNALLVVSGWSAAADDLAAVSSRPLRDQPIRSDGTWLAPWLLSSGVVDSTAGAIIPLGFDIRDGGPLAYSQTLRKYLPGQAPTGSGFAGWGGREGGSHGSMRLFAASRAAYMPADHDASHETTISWFPGGTITPVGHALEVS